MKKHCNWCAWDHMLSWGGEKIMHEVPAWWLNTFTNIMEVIRTAAPVATAWIAFLALKNWQRQDKAKREAEFLDDLIESTHAYIVDMHRPIELLHLAKIGMASHVKTWEEGEESAKAVKGAIAYIEKHGEQHGKTFASALASVEPSVIKLRSLATKGQIFKFKDYTQCSNAVTLLARHFDRLLSFHSIISSSTWNWENPEVLSLLTKVMAIEPDEIRESIGENNVAVIEFASKTYERIYS